MNSVVNPESPFSSIEIRWFFPADADDATLLVPWYSTTSPLPVDDDVGRPEWQPRCDDAPDRYLPVPGASDFNIKWREGHLQLKGRTGPAEAAQYAPSHSGLIEHWVKWSYDDMPAAWRRQWFDSEGAVLDVRKVRAMRLFAIGAGDTDPREVQPDRRIERGVGFELADIELRGLRYRSLAFEAFPADATTRDGFDRVVSAMLATLEDVTLEREHSLSYAAFVTQFA